VTYAKGDGHFVHGDHRRIAVAALKAADVLLAEARKLCKLFLGQTLFLSNPPDVLPDQPVCPCTEVSGLHTLSVSTIICRARASEGNGVSFDCMNLVVRFDRY
jgi:hypothetical protein